MNAQRFCLAEAAPPSVDYWRELQLAGGRQSMRGLASPLGVLRDLDALSEVPRRARLRILRNFSCEPLVPWLRLASYDRGVRLRVDLGDLNVLHQELLDSTSPSQREPYDALMLALWSDYLAAELVGGSRSSKDALVHSVRDLVELATQSLTTTLLITTLAPRSGEVVGSKMNDAIDHLNDWLRALPDQISNVRIVDVARIGNQIGWREAVDRRMAGRYQAPLGIELMHRMSESVSQIVAAEQGRMRKVLVLDCDNTLWQGTLGETGIDGIQMSPHDWPGAAFHTFQQQVLQLQWDGVVLALCSKNNESEVVEVLRNHPDSLLRLEHFAAWRINWNDKAQNLWELSRELRLGLESFCFVDDCAVECDRIRQALPMVDVLQVPESPADLPRLLEDYPNFWTAIRSAEDRLRTDHYRAERERLSLRSVASSLDEYLASLKLVAKVAPLSEANASRAAQLVARSNQFNLSSRRRSEAELGSLLHDDDTFVLSLDAADRFGNYGLTGLAIVQRQQQRVVLDTFLLSCRILGRQFEDALLMETIAAIRERWPAQPVHADYLASGKNEQIPPFLNRMGFRVVDAHDGGATYLFPDSAPVALPRHVHLVRNS